MARFDFLRRQKPTEPKEPLPEEAFVLWPIVLIGNPELLPFQPQGAMAQLLEHFNLEVADDAPPVVAKFVAIIQGGKGKLDEIKKLLSELMNMGLVDRDIANLLYATAYFKQHKQPPAGAVFDRSAFNVAQLAAQSGFFGPQFGEFPDFWPEPERSQFGWPDEDRQPWTPQPRQPRRPYQARTSAGPPLRVMPPEPRDERETADEGPSEPLVPPHPEGEVYIFRRDWSWVTANDRFFVIFGIGLWVLATMAISAIVTVPNWIEQIPIFLLAAAGWATLLVLRITYWRADMIRVDTSAGTLEYQRRPQWWNPTSCQSLKPGRSQLQNPCETSLSGVWGVAGIGSLNLALRGKDIRLDGLRFPDLIGDFIHKWGSRSAKADELAELYHEWQTRPSPLNTLTQRALRFLWNCRYIFVLPIWDLRNALDSFRKLRREKPSTRVVWTLAYSILLPLTLLASVIVIFIYTPFEPITGAGLLALTFAIYLVRAQRHVSFQMPAVSPDGFAGERVVEVPRAEPSLATSTTITPVSPAFEWERFQGVPKRAGVPVRCAVCSEILGGALERPPKVYPAVIIKFGDWATTVYFHDLGEQVTVVFALQTQNWPTVFQLLKGVRWPAEFLALAAAKE